MNWPSKNFLELTGVDLPIIQVPMAGANGSAMPMAAIGKGA